MRGVKLSVDCFVVFALLTLPRNDEVEGELSCNDKVEGESCNDEVSIESSRNDEMERIESSLRDDLHKSPKQSKINNFKISINCFGALNALQ